MTRQSSTDGLVAATKRRRTEAQNKIRKAVRDMKKKGIAINPNSVSRYAKVARKTIYNNKDLLELVRAAGGLQRPHASHVGTEGSATESTITVALRAELRSQKHRYDTDTAALKSQIKQLRQDLAVVHGELQQLRKGRAAK